MGVLASKERESFSEPVGSVSCRLLYLIGQLHTGGSERQLYYLLRAMDRERYRPAVAVWSYGENDVYVRQLRDLGVPLYGLTNGASRAKKLTEFRRLVKTVRPEVVHSFSFYTNFAAYWGTLRGDAVPIGSIRSNFSYAKKDSGPLIGRLSARWPAVQISNASSVAEEIKRTKGFFSPRRISVVRNAFDVEKFHYMPIQDKQPVVIAGIGYLLPVKRWDRLLSASQELQNQNLPFVVKIAGDGPLRPTLERQTAELRLNDRVTFLGHVDDVSKILAKASFVIHTADSEGSPNSVLEAMACGRAVICTDVGDVSSLVEDGKTGFLVRAGDDATLIARMRTLIMDRALCKMMGIAARARVERELGLDGLMNEMLDVYRAAGWRESVA